MVCWSYESIGLISANLFYRCLERSVKITVERNCDADACKTIINKSKEVQLKIWVNEKEMILEILVIIIANGVDYNRPQSVELSFRIVRIEMIV